MPDKIFGLDFTNETNPTAGMTISVHNGTALRDVELQYLYKAFGVAATQAILDLLSTTQGAILYYNGTDWVALPPGTTGDFLKTLGAAANPVWATAGWPRGHLWGLTLSNNATDPTNDIDIAAGEARSSTNDHNITLDSAITKRLDAAWVVGTNQGGLDTGTIANNTYHVWLIKRSDTGVEDVLFSLSATAPTMPANYDYKRRIGSIVRLAGALKGFVQDADTFTWKTPVNDVNVANPGTTAVTRTLTLPVGIRVEAIMGVAGYIAAGAIGDYPAGIYISDLSIDDVAAGVTAAFSSQVYLFASDAQLGGTTRVFTNTSAQVRSRITVSTAKTNVVINTHGWVDARGRVS